MEKSGNKHATLFCNNSLMIIILKIAFFLADLEMENYPVKIDSINNEKIRILINDAIDWAHVC